MMSSAVVKTVRVLSRLPRHAQLNLVQTRNMFKMDPAGLMEKHIPSTGVSNFIQKLRYLAFDSEESVTLFDIGCGPGHLTKHALCPMFPNIKKCIAIDVLPDMIECAEKNYWDSKIEYNVGDIEDWDSVKKWNGMISKLFAVDSFQWVQNQRLGFENIYKLLQPGGEAAIYMVLQAMYFEGMDKIHKDPKWNRYFNNVGSFIGVPHMQSYHEPNYRRMVEDVGFAIEICDENLTIEPFSSDREYRNFFASICGLVEHIPENRREEFKDDLFWYVLRENGRSSEGRPLHVGTTLELVIRKD